VKGKSDGARAFMLNAGLVSREALAEADDRIERGPDPGPRPTGEFRAFLLESGGLSRDERLLIETDDRRAVEVLREGWDASDAALREEWRLYEVADLIGEAA